MALEPTTPRSSHAAPSQGLKIPTSFDPLIQNARNSKSRLQKRSKWLGPCVSFLCLIHCFSLPFILLLAPSLFHFVPFQFVHDLEVIFWILALDLGVYSMKQAAVSLRWQRIFVSISLLVPPTIITGSYRLTQVLLALMAVMQFVLVFWKHRSPQDEPECCNDH